ncbi:hypothetical protein STAS_22675 [Striga asiatica]|uniref:Uncharacterized protein n=1 Tax=Striga asiatica TaxID=4170 RepID=A0A5A7QMM8_STRAF|nr:hypothetical protein STAS_22675 [Striga asiatica]
MIFPVTYEVASTICPLAHANSVFRSMEKGKTDNLWLFKSIFSKRSNGSEESADAHAANENVPIYFLSSNANSVAFRCSKILGISTEELQEQFDFEVPDYFRQPPLRARNFVEFCSYKALHMVTSQPNYLNDKDFSRLTFDMMIAWEAPGVDSDLIHSETVSCGNQDVEGEDGWSLFYSSSTKMAVQVDNKKTVGPEAFARIAPACPIIADITTVHNLFDVLTSSSGPRLHFLIYNKYIQSLEKVAKFMQNAVGPHVLSNLPLADGEFIIDVDGTAPTQPVLQHIGMSAWPGRLTLSNYALYFETGVGLYDKAVRYDLATEMKQVIKPELTGPLGARLFDKAVMYKSTSIAEPVYLEFPEFKGCSRRDYWLDICLEILRAHKFIRKYNLKENQQFEALARAVLGIFRFRAVREAFHISSSSYKTLLCFNLAESLPGGDMILETLSGRLTLISSTTSAGYHDFRQRSPSANRQQLSPAALVTLIRLKIVSSQDSQQNSEATYRQAGDIAVGESNPLEAVVKQLKQDTGMAEAAQATVDQVKVEGIDTNLAVMKVSFLEYLMLYVLELLFPVIEMCNRLNRLASWDDPYRSVIFVLFFSYVIVRDWVRYMLPSIFIVLSLVMLCRRYAWKRVQLEAFKIVGPPNKNPVEQLLTLQEAITQTQSLIQSGNITLLKLRALLFAVPPQQYSENRTRHVHRSGLRNGTAQARNRLKFKLAAVCPAGQSCAVARKGEVATDELVLLLVVMAIVLAFVPTKYLILVLFLEGFTRNMPLRKESSERGVRRLREWWIRIPAAPVRLTRPDDKKRK